jgi:hypothetical protein
MVNQVVFNDFQYLDYLKKSQDPKLEELIARTLSNFPKIAHTSSTELSIHQVELMILSMSENKDLKPTFNIESVVKSVKDIDINADDFGDKFYKIGIANYIAKMARSNGVFEEAEIDKLDASVLNKLQEFKDWDEMKNFKWKSAELDKMIEELN